MLCVVPVVRAIQLDQNRTQSYHMSSQLIMLLKVFLRRLSELQDAVCEVGVLRLFVLLFADTVLIHYRSII